MDRVFRVRIDTTLLRSHLSGADRQTYTGDHVRKFLLDSGFVPDGEWWIVNEKTLGALEPSEVLEAEVLGEPD